MKKFLLILLTAILLSGSICAAEDKSFVDKMVYETLLFEEDSADEFLAEKREINRLCTVESESEVVEGFHTLNVKLQELNAKEVARYGDNYTDWDAAFAEGKLLACNAEIILTQNLLQQLVGHTGDDLKKILRDKTTWENFRAAADQLNANANVPLELDFRMDKKIVDLCKDTLGDNDPVTLRHTINLIHDYSLMGDSKTALTMAKKLFPKVEKTFGNDSIEALAVLSLIANDCKVLGNYKAAEETLLKAIAINKKIHGAESSPELLANLVALAELKKIASSADKQLLTDLDNAAKDLPAEILNKSGYSRVKVSLRPLHTTERLIDLNETIANENALMKTFRRDDYLKCVDMLFLQAESSKLLGLYEAALTYDLVAMADCKMNLGSYHHKTLQAMCNLSDDYLTLNQTDDALALAQAALNTAQKIYGNDHPCTIYATHSLTNVCRKLNRHAEALALDKKAYADCKKIFLQNSDAESFEAMTALADIADDCLGMKDYPAAKKYCVDFIVKYNRANAYAPKAMAVLKNLTALYNADGDYDKTVKLYDFLREQDNSYSLESLPVDGLLAGQIGNVLGNALAEVGKPNEADYVFLQEIVKFERVRLINISAATENKLEWFAQTVPYYKNTAAFFISEGENIDALRAVELCKGRTLADQYRDLLATYKSGLSSAEIQTLNEYRDKISAYKDNFRREFEHGSDALKFNLRMAQITLVHDYDSYVKQLTEKYPRYDEMLDSGRINSGVRSDLFFTVENLKTLVPPNHCYISFAVAEKQVLALVADDTGTVKSFVIAVDDNFADNCRAYHELFEIESFGYSKFLWQLPDGNYKVTGNRERPTADARFINSKGEFKTARQKLSAQIGETLLEPLAGSIAAKTWIISPDAELNTIPFETLTFNGEMIIKSKNLSYVPSLAVLQLMRDAGEKNSRLAERKELFAMGNAVYEVQGDGNLRGTSEISRMHEPLINLPGTAKEIEKVSSHFQKNLQAVMTGRNASERNLKQLDTSGALGQYKRILFAAHGLFIPEKPELSSIVLSQGLDDADFDGYVTVGEWLGYNLNSDLIYLSACESGRGDYQAGEGIIGIPYALTVAGNKDTVMSLWPVRDESTAEFSAAVFEKLSRGQSEIQALNETKREFLSSDDADLNDPAVWAAFVLYGI